MTIYGRLTEMRNKWSDTFHILQYGVKTICDLMGKYITLTVSFTCGMWFTRIREKKLKDLLK